MTGSPDTATTTESHDNNDVDMPPSVPYRGGSHNHGSNHSQSSYSYASTCTPKRRRKANGGKGNVRFSPEKRSQWRDDISRSGSLLDHPHSSKHQHTYAEEEDDTSLLAGTGIRIPSYCEPNQDELSYSDSDASAGVAKDLGKELTWEELQDDTVDHEWQSIGDEGESYASRVNGGLVYHRNHQRGLLSRNASLEVLSSPGTSPIRQRQHKSHLPYKSMIGGVVTVREPKQTHTLFHSPKSLGRQPSVCSELTMDALVSEHSSSQKSDDDSCGESSCSDSSTVSRTSADSWRRRKAILSGGESDTSSPQLRSPHRSPRSPHRSPRSPHRSRTHRQHPKAGHGHGQQRQRRAHTTTTPTRRHPTRHDQETMDTTQDSLQWMWSTEDNYNNINHNLPQQPRRRRRSASRTKKRRKSRSRSRVARWQEDSSPTKTADQSTSFLFPFQQLTEGFHQSSAAAGEPNAAAKSDDDEEGETSILLDLTEDLKEIAIIAGKSSENLVSNILHHLWEES